MDAATLPPPENSPNPDSVKPGEKPCAMLRFGSGVWPNQSDSVRQHLLSAGQTPGTFKELHDAFEESTSDGERERHISSIEKRKEKRARSER